MARQHRRVLARALAILIALPPPALAQQMGGQVVAGEVTLARDGSRLTLDQISHAAIVNWERFGIAPHEFVRVVQPGADAAMLARVVGNDPSQLLGHLQADGRFFLINSRGIIVGRDAVIDTAAFLASTLDVTDRDFLAGGPLTFTGDSGAGVVNLGRITAREGNVLLLAHTVRNAGQIAAAKGAAVLAAGTEVFLASPDAPRVVIRTNLPTTEAAAGVENSGVVEAAQAQLEAAGGSIYDLAINQTGVVRATGAGQLPDGRVVLTAAGGNVLVGGTVAAHNAGGTGGEILIGGDFQGGNPSVANAARTLVAPGARLDASATTTAGDGGRVIVWADNTTHFFGALDARAGAQGGDGGFAEVSGKRALTFAGAADLSAPAGTLGSLLLDPDNITIVAGSTALPPGLDGDVTQVWQENEDPGSHNLGADTLTGLLANASVNLQAADTLTVSAPITVAGGGTAGVTLTLQAATVAINQSISLANVSNGGIRLIGAAGSTSATTAAGATLSADRIEIGRFPIVTLNGPVTTARLSFDTPSPPTSLTATNASNAITRLLILNDEANPAPVTFSGSVSVHSGSAMDVSALIAGATGVTLSAAGNLTMRGTDGLIPASAITSSGTVKLAATSGVFINAAGTGLLSGAGRRVLYTPATGGAFTLGGLTGYTQVDGVGFPNDPNTGLSQVLYVGTAAMPTLTITANDFTRFYGQANPTFTVSFAGGTSADLTTQPVLTLVGAPALNAGTYTIVPSGAASATHQIAYVNGTLTVRPATLTYVAAPASRVYGDANPAFGGTVSGFVAGDTLASATTGTLTFSSPATAASNAGSHAILGSGLAANHGNYVFEQAIGNFSALTIGRAPLTVTIADATRTYGSSNPPFAATFTGLRNSDTAGDVYAIGTAATANSPVGEYAIVLVASGPAVNNYTLTAATPGTLTITPAPLALTIPSLSWTYGDPLVPIPIVTASGLVLGQSLGSVVRINPPDRRSPAGTHTIVPELISPNYRIDSISGGVVTIARRPLTVTVNDALKERYWPMPAFGVTLVNVADFDEAAATAHFSRVVTSATPNSPAGTYTVTPARSTDAAFPNLSNYVVSIVPGTLTVEPEQEGIILITGSLLYDMPNELRNYSATTTSATTLIGAEDLEFRGLGVDSEIEIMVGAVSIWEYDEVLVTALDRLREAIDSDPDMRKALEGAGLLALLESGDSAAFLADIGGNSLKQGLLLPFLDGVLLDYARRPRQDVPAYITGLLDELTARTGEQKVREARLLVEKFDAWNKETKAAEAQRLSTVFGGATAPDFLPEVKAELLAAAIATGVIAGSLATAATVAALVAAATVATTATGAATSMATLAAMAPAAAAAGPAAIILVAVIAAAVRGIQVFEEAEVLAAVDAARTLVNNPSSATVNLDDEADRLSFTTTLYEYINEKG